MKRKFSARNLLIISWVVLVVFCLLFIRQSINNSKLNNLVVALERKVALEDGNKRYEALKSEKEKIGDEALKYLSWQFVLKGQIEQSRDIIINKLNKIKDHKQNKELQNLFYYNLGLSHTLTMDFGSAINAFETALRFDPKDAQSCYNLGLLNSTYGKETKKAIRYYKRYLEIAPTGTKADAVKDRIKALENK